MRMVSKLLTATALSGLLAAPALAQNPYTQPDDTWISLSGTVVAPTEETFMLDYGDGVVTVEMDDWDAYGEANYLRDGDRVTVYGEVDDDLFEATTIEANSVYVEGLNTYFYANSVDEEEFATWPVSTPIVVSATTVRGTVSDVDPLVQEFTINTGARQITVDTDNMMYNPLDEHGYQQIEEGDFVAVSGEFDSDFLEGRELMADAVITLADMTPNS